jgi:hypothetical protein
MLCGVANRPREAITFFISILSLISYFCAPKADMANGRTNICETKVVDMSSQLFSYVRPPNQQKTISLKTAIAGFECDWTRARRPGRTLFTFIDARIISLIRNVIAEIVW